MDHAPEQLRPSDLSISRANPMLAAQLLDWRARIDMPGVVAGMLAPLRALAVD